MNIRFLLLTVAVGIACLFFDYFYLDVITTPLVGICVMMLAATRLNWKATMGVGAILVVFVVLSLIGQDLARILVRLGSFLVGCGLAVAFSRSRELHQQAMQASRLIIQGLPQPVVASDMTGQIISASDEALRRLDFHDRPLTGYSFPDVFLGNLPPGKATKVYMDWFEREGVHSENLYLRSNPQQPVVAKVSALGLNRDRLLMVSIGDAPLARENPSGL